MAAAQLSASTFARGTALPAAPRAGPTSGRSVVTQALFTRSRPKQEAAAKPIDKAKKMETFVGAMDFSSYRTKEEANMMYELMYDEKGNKKGLAKGQKLTPEQYRALKRKIGGTAKDYFKSWVDVQGKYTDRGYESSTGTSNLVGAPLLGLTLAGVLAVLVAVVMHAPA